VVITQREKPETVKGPGRFFTERELREKGKNIKRGWRKVLGDTETAPSPVKTPTKTPEKHPTKEPRVNPFKKPEHIRPSKEPQPKALPITYPQGAKLKIHPELERQINSKDTPYHSLPQLPGGEFIENIASDRFKLILRNLERYSGKPVRSLRDIAVDLMDVIQKIDQIERQHISELEDLAVSLVEQQFGIDPKEVGFDAKLVRNVTIEDIKNISPEEEKGIEKELPTIDVDLEVSKRTFINGLIQGAGINSLNMFHLVSDELNTIDPNLINMYGLLTAFAELGYWVTPSLVGTALSGGPVGGKVQLDFSQEEPRVVAVAINFPILVQELVKGVMELMSSHGLPEDESIRDQVLNKADTLEDESWDIRFGPEIWKKLLFHINTTELNGRALSILYYNLVQLDAAIFSDFVYKILSNNQESINKWNEMYNEALNQSSKTSSLGVHTNQDEELVDSYNQYRKEMLSKGETPELYFNWIKDV
jgi:septum formation topological specificity factor MinE